MTTDDTSIESSTTRTIRLIKAEGWDEGRRAGVGDMAAIIGWGTRGAPEDDRPASTPNPYRTTVATPERTTP